MKRSVVLLVLLMVVGAVAFAQSDPKSKKKKINWQPKNVSAATSGQKESAPLKMSAQTQFLLMDIQAAQGDAGEMNKLVEKYMLIQKGNTLYANSFILCSPELQTSVLEALDVIPATNLGNIRTGMIPVHKLQSVADLPEVIFVQIGQRVHLKTDSARKSSNVDKVHGGVTPLSTSYHGEGVVVGIIDDGFDLTHPNFYDTTGTANYRIKRVWFHTDNSGTPPTGYSYGTELTTMNAMLNTGTDDTAETHGTHVAGIAAGAGGFPNSPYKGVATKSDLVFVGTNFSNVSIAEGIQYIQDYAASVNKPCVINMSIGGHTGPHDGTSVFDKYCDAKVKPGNLIVGAAGNEGDKRLFLGHNYNSTDTLIHTFLVSNKSNFGNDIVAGADIWGNRNEQFSIIISLYNTDTDITEDNTIRVDAHTASAFHDTLTGTNSRPVYLAIQSGIDPSNGKPHIIFQVDNTAQPDGDRNIMITVIGHNTATKMWAIPDGALFVDWNYGVPVYDGNATHTVGEIGGTANSIISVGAYTTKKQWTDLYTNTLQKAPSYDSVGAIATFSSRGPTADGRVKPDITAPGNIVASSMNSFDVSISNLTDRLVDSVNVGGDNYHFVMFEGTSMATPMVTGILALWLERYPELTVEHVKGIFEETAMTDTFTGNIPLMGSNTWGWGKIDAFGGLTEMIKYIPGKPTNTTLTLCEGPGNTLAADTGFEAYQWTSGDTARIVSANKSGGYAYRVMNEYEFYSPWSDTTVVHPLPAVAITSVFNNTLTASPAASYQWYRDNVAIPGATQHTHTAIKTGNYHVTVTDNNGCSNASQPIHFVPTGVAALGSGNNISLYPNPATDNIYIDGLQQPVQYNVADLYGSTVQKGNISPSNPGINIATLSPGIYILNVADKAGNNVLKFVRQ